MRPLTSQLINFCFNYADGKWKFVIFHVSRINHFSFFQSKVTIATRIESFDWKELRGRKHWGKSSEALDESFEASECNTEALNFLFRQQFTPNEYFYHIRFHAPGKKRDKSVQILFSSPNLLR
jgi:hypothetical protein